jgi:ribosomal protein S18 acetylase RimI-like enzyme
MRSAIASDVPAVRNVLAEAFVTDPLVAWAFGRDEHELEMAAAWFGLFVEAYIASGRVDLLEVSGEVAATAIWRIPNDAAIAMPARPTPHGLLAAFVGAERSREILEGLQEFAKARPDPPFAYLHFLAVSPSHQRQGFGAQVVRPGLDAADAAHLGVELETTNEANLTFYRSLGFEVTKEFNLGPTGPPGWAMWRPASDL